MRYAYVEQTQYVVDGTVSVQLKLCICNNVKHAVYIWDLKKRTMKIAVILNVFILHAYIRYTFNLKWLYKQRRVPYFTYNADSFYSSSISTIVIIINIHYRISCIENSS
jgi:hypothetical protein